MTRIFLVEDDKAIAKTSRFYFARRDLRSATQPLGEASAMLAGNLFDLALVDIALPDGNGFTVCTEIKERYQIPVLFLTASVTRQVS